MSGRAWWRTAIRAYNMTTYSARPETVRRLLLAMAYGMVLRRRAQAGNGTPLELVDPQTGSIVRRVPCKTFNTALGLSMVRQSNQDVGGTLYGLTESGWDVARPRRCPVCGRPNVSATPQTKPRGDVNHRHPRGGDGSECVPGCPACCYDLLLLVAGGDYKRAVIPQRQVLAWTWNQREDAMNGQRASTARRQTTPRGASRFRNT